MRCPVPITAALAAVVFAGQGGSVIVANRPAVRGASVVRLSLDRNLTSEQPLPGPESAFSGAMSDALCMMLFLGRKGEHHG